MQIVARIDYIDNYSCDGFDLSLNAQPVVGEYQIIPDWNIPKPWEVPGLRNMDIGRRVKVPITCFLPKESLKDLETASHVWNRSLQFGNFQLRNKKRLACHISYFTRPKHMNIKLAAILYRNLPDCKFEFCNT